MFDPEAVNKELLKPTGDSEFQKKLLEHCKDCLRLASEEMSKNYTAWDNSEYLYRGYRPADKEDARSAEKKEPTKILVPLAFAQLQTYLAFMWSAFNQRDQFYEVQGMAAEDASMAEGLNRDLAYQMSRNDWALVFYDLLLSAGKYGFGVVQATWEVETQKVRGRVPAPPSFMDAAKQMLGLPVEPTFQETILTVTSYEGTKFKAVSPYNFLPDPAVSLARFQEGGFVACDEEVTLQSLKNLEGKDYFGTEHIKKAGATGIDWNYRKRRVGSGWSSTTDPTGEQASRKAVRTDMQIKLVPKEWNEQTKTNLFGDEQDEVIFNVVIANDDKIIQFKPAGYLHDRFNFEILEYSQDGNSSINPGLVSIISELQQLFTWYINSRVANVKQNIKNRFIGNPEKVFAEDLESDKALIRTRGAGVTDLDRALKQLDVRDVTNSHMQDLSIISELVQQVTGINENALGQYSSGRRSAAEARAVNSSASARLKMQASMNWTQCFRPLGEQLVSNTRQGRSKAVYDRILGADAAKYPYEVCILATPEQIGGAYDFMPYDATLPSERGQIVATLKELLMELMKTPGSAQALGLDLGKMLKTAVTLSGLKNFEDFTLPQGPGQMPGQVQVIPNEEAAALAAGQVTPNAPAGAMPV